MTTEKRNRSAYMMLKSADIQYKTYIVRIYSNDDVYERKISAVRLSIMGSSILFYDSLEQIIAVYPTNFTEVVMSNEPRK